MKLTFKEFFEMQEYEQLDEKLILYNNGKKYGQIVFLAGGAGSGKGFARQRFISAESFKVRDVDELKMQFMKMDLLDKFTTKELLAKYGRKLPDKWKNVAQRIMIDQGTKLSQFDLKNPEHVELLHFLVKATGAKEKTLDSMLNGAKTGRLPNIFFDITFKDLDEFNRVIPDLLRVGYETQNIHLTWVLTNYNVAVKNNKKRSRTVADDILLQTHKGAAQTVYTLVKDDTPKEINGRVDVILNNPENTVSWKDAQGNDIKNAAGPLVKDFTYLRLKDAGKPAKKEIEVKKQLLTWIRDNTPEGSLDTSELDKM
jgi:hypothetical protein